MNGPAPVPVGSWGRLSSDASCVFDLSDRARVCAEVSRTGPKGLAYGNGRSYGDVCLNPGGRIWRTRRLDRFIAFDPGTGVVRCEAGVLLGELVRLVLPHGWFVPVTPGTQFATVGGAIANDVHGKNHHREGTFGRHVRRLALARTDGSLIACSPTEQTELFNATVGGLGLTGVIVEAELRLRPVPGPWMDVETIAFSGLEGFFALSEESDAKFEYTVAWIDCSARGRANGRGVFFRANHSPERAATRTRRSGRLFFTPPVSLVNRLTLRSFNAAYFNLHRARQGAALKHYVPYFYPLDSLSDWNRIYGPRGFFQYQCVLPTAAARAGTQAMLDATARAGAGSFLAVAKVFGDIASPGLLSFPQAGTTLALDFPNDGVSTQALFGRLDAIVAEAGGRLYPAKDARMPRAMFERGYPELGRFVRQRDAGLDSAMARRLMS